MQLRDQLDTALTVIDQIESKTDWSNDTTTTSLRLEFAQALIELVKDGDIIEDNYNNKLSNFLIAPYLVYLLIVANYLSEIFNPLAQISPEAATIVILFFLAAWASVPVIGVYFFTNYFSQNTDIIDSTHDSLITSGQLPEKLVNLDSAIRKLNEHWERSSQQAPPDTSRLVDDVDSSVHQTKISSNFNSTTK